MNICSASKAPNTVFFHSELDNLAKRAAKKDAKISKNRKITLNLCCLQKSTASSIPHQIWLDDAVCNGVVESFNNTDVPNKQAPVRSECKWRVFCWSWHKVLNLSKVSSIYLILRRLKTLKSRERHREIGMNIPDRSCHENFRQSIIS